MFSSLAFWSLTQHPEGIIGACLSSTSHQLIRKLCSWTQLFCGLAKSQQWKLMEERMGRHAGLGCKHFPWLAQRLTSSAFPRWHFFWV